jgi:hypothetical protein
MKRALSLAAYFFVSIAAAGPGIQKAYVASGIQKSDSLEVKIDKALILLNEKGYFKSKNPGQKLPPPFDISYQLDSLRTPEQMLEQKVGGNCGTYSRTFAALLKESGVPDSDMQIVETVMNSELAIICPKAGVPRVANPESGAGGHSFVALKMPNGKWQIINTIDGSRTYERADWYSPEELQSKMKSEAVAVPYEAFKKLPEDLYFSGLTAFQSWKPSEAPMHSFDQRFDLIASGKIEKSLAVCRFTAPAFAAKTTDKK